MSDKKVFAKECWADKSLLEKYDDYHEHIMKCMRTDIADHIVMQITNGENVEKNVRMPQVEMRDSPRDGGVMYKQYIIFEDLVRCKECLHRKTPDCPMCEYIRLMRCEDTFTVNTCITANTWRKIDHTTDDDFCSKGKRKEDPT